MKVLGVSQRIDKICDRREIRDSLDQSLTILLDLVGVKIVPIPNLVRTEANGQPGLQDFLSHMNLDGFILSGGNNIGEYASRDLVEFDILNYAYANSKPLLGICRGMQMISHWAGTDTKRVSGHVGTRHNVNGLINGNVNSSHEFSLLNCPDGFFVTAYSEDGEIEAIISNSNLIEGWMWHPEREKPYSCNDIERLQSLFSL